MSKIRILGLALILATPASSLYAQAMDTQSDEIVGIDMSVVACEGKEAGAACSFTNSFNTEYSGTCQNDALTFDGGVKTGLSCVPND